MLRAQFVRTLRKIGDIAIPEGHARRNKGVTTYFFDNAKLEQVEHLLTEQGLQNKGQPSYWVAGTTWWENADGSCRILRHLDNGWFAIALIRWPA